MFATGIIRSWELLGLRGGGPLDLLTESIANHGSRSPGEPDGGQALPPRPEREDR